MNKHLKLYFLAVTFLYFGLVKSESGSLPRSDFVHYWEIWDTFEVGWNFQI